MNNRKQSTSSMLSNEREIKELEEKINTLFAEKDKYQQLFDQLSKAKEDNIYDASDPLKLGSQIKE